MDKIIFTLSTDFIELFKLLKVTGLCESGGIAKSVIADSYVEVNGEVETRKAFKVRAGTQVEFNEQIILIEGAKRS